MTYILDKCWEIKECQIRDRCPVYPHFGRSCWLIRDKLKFLYGADEDMECKESCDSCEVFQWHQAFLRAS